MPTFSVPVSEVAGVRANEKIVRAVGVQERIPRLLDNAGVRGGGRRQFNLQACCSCRSSGRPSPRQSCRHYYIEARHPTQ